MFLNREVNMKDYIVYHANKFGTAGAGFTEVAVVSADSLSQAYQLTNNIEESWVENYQVKISEQEFSKGLRSTSSGDVIFDPETEEYFFLVPMGYQNSGATVVLDKFDIDGFTEFTSKGEKFDDRNYYVDYIAPTVNVA